MDESHHDLHHVHFDTTVMNDELHDNTIVYQVVPDVQDRNSIMVHLGFLQINHRYRIELCIPEYAFVEAGLKVGTNSNFELDESLPLNINCKLLEFSSAPTIGNDGKRYYSAKIVFFAHKEKLLKERIFVNDKNDISLKLQLVFLARVLGRGKGTPMLRDGIHLIDVENDESELSDWQGFPKKEK
ncbi:adipose-secreted signaling protein isoform X2 [Malaya genurostris]|nr:adipose-secreted signaling protein isoform X2 [Malaya genurostris]XP_058454003.1 adipose-secreted signaling protein isoform X2 [Malaya genurostris]XP_058454004.1 adipose-secreted signaling protein isoform X2 [Malaya genurostris]